MKSMYDEGLEAEKERRCPQPGKGCRGYEHSYNPRLYDGGCRLYEVIRRERESDTTNQN